MAAAEFWYEFASTYSYPAAMRVADLAQSRGVALAWQPFLLGPIFAAQGWRDSPFNKAAKNPPLSHRRARAPREPQAGCFAETGQAASAEEAPAHRKSAWAAGKSRPGQRAAASASPNTIATVKSAKNVSSVSPDRWETTVFQPALRQSAILGLLAERSG